jgi:glutathione S-transferase
MLYVDHDGTAPSPRRVRIFLAEKGVEIPTRRLRLHVENRTPEFLAKNPVGSLPVLELDDGTCLAESLSICRYLEELHPEPALFGATPLERALVDMWTRRIELYAYVPLDLAPGFVESAPAAAEKLRNWARLALRFLDGVLAERPFVAGERYTIADVVALASLDYGARFADFPLPGDHVHLARWHARVSARPSARA